MVTSSVIFGLSNGCAKCPIPITCEIFRAFVLFRMTKSDTYDRVADNFASSSGGEPPGVPSIFK